MNPSIIIHSSHPVNDTLTSACHHLSKHCARIVTRRTSERESEIHNQRRRAPKWETESNKDYHKFKRWRLSLSDFPTTSGQTDRAHLIMAGKITRCKLARLSQPKLIGPAYPRMRIMFYVLCVENGTIILLMFL